jgi:protein-S-isoprenylcysteine O-methyltransferase Ste14
MSIMKLRTRNYFFNYLTLFLVSIFLFFFLRFYLSTDKPVNIFSYIGLLLLVPSITLFTIARIQLGGSFQVSAEANQLVKTGIYKKVRHPIYLFGLIFLLGIIFITQTFFLIIIWVIVSGFQLKRIHQEEKVLTEKFGDEYIEYKKQTWF